MHQVIFRLLVVGLLASSSMLASHCPDRNPTPLSAEIPSALVSSRDGFVRIALGLRVDLNAGSQKDLEAIPGIGAMLAARIVHGRPYDYVEDLLEIHGMGKATLGRIAPFVTVISPKFSPESSRGRR